MELYLTTLSQKTKIKYISKLQRIYKVEKTKFFTPFSNGNTPLSGNFFCVTESCHLMTMSCIYQVHTMLHSVGKLSVWVWYEWKINKEKKQRGFDEIKSKPNDIYQIYKLWNSISSWFWFLNAFHKALALHFQKVLNDSRIFTIPKSFCPIKCSFFGALGLSALALPLWAMPFWTMPLWTSTKKRSMYSLFLVKCNNWKS